MSIGRIAGAIFLLVAMSTGLSARASDKNPEYALRTEGFGAPSTKWMGDGYAGGPLRVLVLYGDQVYHGGRELAEFKRALALDAEYAIVGGFQTPSVDTTRLQEFLENREWDVVMTWSSGKSHCSRNLFGLLPPDMQFEMVRRVHDDGMGLLFRYYPHKPLLREERKLKIDTETPLAGIGFAGRAIRDEAHWRRNHIEPDTAGQGVFDAYGLGKGRIVAINPRHIAAADAKGLTGWADGTDWSPRNRTDADYYMAELGRILLYAAGKEPQVLFAKTPPARWNMASAKTQGATFGWTLRVEGEPRDIVVTWRLRRTTGEVVARGEKSFPKASGEIVCENALPALGGGHYMLDVFVDGPRGRETYGYSAIVVEEPFVVKVALDSQGVEPGASLQGSVSLEVKRADRNPPAPKETVVSLVDDEGRTLLRRSLTVSPGKPATFSLPTDSIHTVGLRVEAEALGEHGRVGWDAAEANVLHRRQDRFNVSLWGGCVGAYARWSWKRRWKEGVTTMMSGGGASANLTSWPWCGQFGGELDGRKVEMNVREMCSPEPDPGTSILTLQPVPWNDEDAFGKLLTLSDGIWRKGTRTPVYVYNLYDEGPSGAMDMSPAGLEDYRTWLREIYGGDLKALNTEWQSDYKDWAEVAPLDNGEGKAKEAGNFARWSDRRRFANVNFCRTILQGFTARARTIDPDARIGFEGSGGYGQDLEELFAANGFWVPYENLSSDLLRSLAPKDYIYGYWIGYTRNGDDLLRRTWNSILDGAPSVWFWMLSGRGRFHGWVAMDDLPYPSRQALIDQCVLPLRRGLGELLMSMEQPGDGVALYYSVAASYADMVADAAFGRSEYAAKSFKLMLEDGGYQWDYLSRERVLDGALAKRNTKVLILPLIRPLGEEEVAALGTFVEKGGTVIADLRPGVLSGHCRRWEQGPADTLFGVERTGPGEAVQVTGEGTVRIGDASLALSLDNAVADADLKAKGATAALAIDGHPLCFVHDVGKGKAILLNMQMDRYASERKAERSAKQRQFLHALLQTLGAAPKVRLEHDAACVPYVERATWRAGGATLHAFLNHGAKSVSATATLPEAGHVFSLRDGPVGETGTLSLAPLREGYPAWFAVYPYDPGEPQIRSDRAEVAPGDTVVFSLAMPDVPVNETAVFAYETRLLNPKGEWVDVIPWSARGVRGQAEVPVRFALDDPPGTWTLAVREVTTGRVAKATIRLKAGKQ